MLQQVLSFNYNCMQKTALITGIAGQDGAYLANFLLKKKYRVVGITMSDKPEEVWRLDFFGIREKVTYVEGSIEDAELIKKLLTTYQPHEMYNLAAQSSVQESWKTPISTFKSNALAVIEMLELIRQYSPHTRLFQASSAEIFGNAKGVRTEETPANPLNPYADSKLAAHMMVSQYRSEYGLYACNGILFTHTSPLQIEFAVAKKIVQSVARIAKGKGEKIILGNMKIGRDWLFAGDVVEAMWRIVQQKVPRDYTISSGKNYTIEEFVAEAFRQVKIKNWKKYVTIDPKFIRKNDVLEMHGSNKRLKSIGWKPKVNFKKLIELMIAHELTETNV